MKKSRAKSPYVDGKPRYKIRNKPGVYIIYQDGAPIYVGYSSNNVYKTMYRHFQSWRDKRQTRVTYLPTDSRITARVIYTRTAKQAAALEYALIVKYQPRDNPTLYLPDEINTPAVVQAYEQYNDIYTFNGDDPF